MDSHSTRPVRIAVRGGRALDADLELPARPRGIVVFAHGSGSGRMSPRNRLVAARMNKAGFATLLVDLLTPDEEAVDLVTSTVRFDVDLLAERIGSAIEWCRQDASLAHLPVGLYGSSTGAAGAIIAAARRPAAVCAVVSRGGRPDLAGVRLAELRAPTLLLVGTRDEAVLRLTRRAVQLMRCEHEIELVPGASHLFEEPGALDLVAERATAWFEEHVDGGARAAAAKQQAQVVAEPGVEDEPFPDRNAAGELLARSLSMRDLGIHSPVVVALPRGGVVVGAPVARALGAPLDVVVSRKIGTPGNAELAMGAVCEDGSMLMDDELVRRLDVDPRTLHALVARARREAHDRAMLVRDGRPVGPLAGRDVVLVDDGYATGMTARTAARMLHRCHANSVMLAVPVGPRELVEQPPPEFDRVLCLRTPEPFQAVGMHYRYFLQVPDAEVHRLLTAAVPPAHAPRTRGARSTW